MFCKHFSWYKQLMMRNTIIFYLAIITILGSSCYFLRFKNEGIDRRIIVNKQAIQQSDYSSVNFNGIYLFTFHNPYNNITHYGYYKFFSNGKVYQSKNYYNEKPSYKQFDSLSNGNWLVYYLQGKNVTIEEFNGYSGYVLHSGYFNENYKQLTLTKYKNLKGKILNQDSLVFLFEPQPVKL